MCLGRPQTRCYSDDRDGRMNAQKKCVGTNALVTTRFMQVRVRIVCQARNSTYNMQWACSARHGQHLRSWYLAIFAKNSIFTFFTLTMLSALWSVWRHPSVRHQSDRLNALVWQGHCQKSNSEGERERERVGRIWFRSPIIVYGGGSHVCKSLFGAFYKLAVHIFYEGEMLKFS